MTAPPSGPEVAKRAAFEASSSGGLPTTLQGCFPGDPEPLSADSQDEAGPLDPRLPGDVFVNPSPRPTLVISAEPRVSASASSHSTVTASRAFSAAHMCSATTATPRGVSTTSTTPGIALAAPASNDLALAPNFGGWIITAVSIPGSFTSSVNGCVPLVFEALS